MRVKYRIIIINMRNIIDSLNNEILKEKLSILNQYKFEVPVEKIFDFQNTQEIQTGINKFTKIVNLKEKQLSELPVIRSQDIFYKKSLPNFLQKKNINNGISLEKKEENENSEKYIKIEIKNKKLSEIPDLSLNESNLIMKKFDSNEFSAFESKENIQNLNPNLNPTLKNEEQHFAKFFNFDVNYFKNNNELHSQKNGLNTFKPILNPYKEKVQLLFNKRMNVDSPKNSKKTIFLNSLTLLNFTNEKKKNPLTEDDTISTFISPSKESVKECIGFENCPEEEILKSFFSDPFDNNHHNLLAEAKISEINFCNSLS